MLILMVMLILMLLKIAFLNLCFSRTVNILKTKSVAVKKSDWSQVPGFVDTSLIFCLEKPKGESLSKVILYSPKAALFQVSSFLFQNDDQAKIY